MRYNLLYLNIKYAKDFSCTSSIGPSIWIRAFLKEARKFPSDISYKQKEFGLRKA
jgi:hypothetical protein